MVAGVCQATSPGSSRRETVRERLGVVQFDNVDENSSHDVDQLRDRLLEQSQVAQSIHTGAAWLRIVEEQRLKTLLADRGELPDDGEVVSALEMDTGSLKRSATFHIEYPGRRLLPPRRGVESRLETLSLEEQRPSRSKTLEGVVQLGDGREKLRGA
jgi:hypothetical protein